MAWRGEGSLAARPAATKALVTDATGGASPVFVGRGPVAWVVAACGATVVVAWLTLGNRAPDGGLQPAWTVVLLIAVAATVAGGWWTRRPRVVVGGLGVWLAPTVEDPPEVHLWKDVEAVVHGRARTRSSRSWYLGVRTRTAPLHTVTPDVQAALDGAASLDALVPGAGSYVADLVRDGRRLRVRTVRWGTVRRGSGLRAAVASVAPGIPVEHPVWPERTFGRVVTEGLWSVVRRR